MLRRGSWCCGGVVQSDFATVDRYFSIVEALSLNTAEFGLDMSSIVLRIDGRRGGEALHVRRTTPGGSLVSHKVTSQRVSRGAPTPIFPENRLLGNTAITKSGNDVTCSKKRFKF